MGVTLFLGLGLVRVQPPPDASLFFKWVLLRVSELLIGARDGKYHRKWIPPMGFWYKYDN